MPNPKIITPVLILSLICLVMTGIVSVTYEATREERAHQEIITANSNRLALFPDAEDFIVTPASDESNWPEGLMEWTKALDADGELLGSLFVSQVRGYGGQVPVLIAIRTDGLVQSIRVLTNEETPGLGKKVEQPAFTDQFSQSSAESLFVLGRDADGQSIDAISGATVSSRAVVNAVNTALEFYQSAGTEES